MMKRMVGVALGVFALVATMNGTAMAGPTPAQKCASTKIKLAGKKAACLLNLDASEEAKDVTKDPLKVQKCKDKLSSAFVKADAKGGCVTTSDGASIEAKVDAFVADIDDDLSACNDAASSPCRKCQSAKLKNVGKKAACLGGLRSKEAAGGGLDPLKVQKCKDKFSSAYVKLDGKGGCVSPGDFSVEEPKVETFVDDVVSELPNSAPPCTCAGTHTKLSFTTGTGAGNCGTVGTSDGSVHPHANLQCSGLFFGSGNNSVPLPAQSPDMGTSITAISACSANTLTLAAAAAGGPEGAINRNCTKAGCLFGPPLPIPNSASPPTSTCVINVVAADAAGTADCSSGASTISLPLTSEIYLTGDKEGAAGIQPCPRCVAGSCTTGPNATLGCTIGDTSLGTAGPTSHDCPPDPLDFIGGLPIGFVLTTGVSQAIAVPSGTQQRVFCGYCQDFTGTGSFQSPANKCKDVTPGGPATGTCPGSFPDCNQRFNGAFGPAGGLAKTITETGSPAGNLNNNLTHNSTLVSVFCIPPTFNNTVDNAADLPGPGAVSLVGTTQMQ